MTDIVINWHFKIPGALHLILEARIKFTELHLKCDIDKTKLICEEIKTLLTQKERCLNSRPLTNLFNDPNALTTRTALTYGHFLISRTLTSIHEPNYLDCNNSYLNGLQLIQKILQQLWKCWHSEYLCRLQERQNGFYQLRIFK